MNLAVDGDVGASLEDDGVRELVAVSRGEDGALHTGQDGITVTLWDVEFHAGRVGQGDQLALTVTGHNRLGLELTRGYVDGYLGLHRDGGGVARTVAEILVGGTDTAGGASVKGMALAVAVGQDKGCLIRPHQEGEVMPAPGSIRALDRYGEGADLGGIGYRKEIVDECIVHGVSSLSIR